MDILIFPANYKRMSLYCPNQAVLGCTPQYATPLGSLFMKYCEQNGHQIERLGLAIDVHLCGRMFLIFRQLEVSSIQYFEIL